MSIKRVLDHALDPIAALDSALHVIGIAIAAAGGLTVFLAQLGMGESWRVGVNEEERTDLVTAGWFSVVRNPIYSAMIVGLLGFALMVPTWLGFAAGRHRPRVGASGAVGRGALPDAHPRRRVPGYASRVGRFVPRVGRLLECW